MNHERALKLQKKIFRSLKAEADLLLAQAPESIRDYEKENQKDFKETRSFRNTTKAQLLEAVQKADVTFIADFHTFNQAQRTALRIAREAIRPDENWFIGLELIPSQFQKSLDDFQSGNISLQTFHEIISYTQEWGFPWQNYSPIFEFARQNGIRLLALNRPKPLFQSTLQSDLHERDVWAAGIVTDIFHTEIQKGHRPKIIVLYGELHVGTHHLPRQLEKISKSFLKKPLTWITIHQNENRLYWKLAQENRKIQTEIVKLKRNVFCVFSSTPWAKLQSFLNWIEEGQAEDSAETDPDYLSLIRNYGNTIADFLGLPHPTYEQISLYTIDQAMTLETLHQNHPLNSIDLKLIRFHLSYNFRFYIPHLCVAYLGSPSQNGAAELAAIHLLRSHNPCKNLFNLELDDFFRITLDSAFGFFSSLILNPRRKCDLLDDHIKRIQHIQDGGKPKFPQEFEARTIAIQTLEGSIGSAASLAKMVKYRGKVHAVMTGAKYLGQILGKGLHQAFLSENLDTQLIRQIFFDPLNSIQPRHTLQYEVLVKTLGSVKLASSKTESF